MIVDEHAQALMIVAEKWIRACCSSHVQSLTSGLQRQRQDGHSFKRRGVFRQRAIMGNHRYIKAQLEGNRSRVAKASTGHKRDANAPFSGLFQSAAIALRYLPARV